MNIPSINNKQAWKDISLVALVLAVFVYAYRVGLQRLVERWGGGDNDYGFLIVPLFFYLLWDKREHFRFKEFSWSYWAIVPAVAGALANIAGELGSMETLLFFGIWLSAVSLMAFLYGGGIRQLAFPITTLFFIIPLPPYLNNTLTFKLKMAASKMSVEMLRASGVSVFLEGNIIDLGINKLQVVDACSGLRYFMPMILMGLLVGYFFTKGWWRRTVLLGLVVPLSIFINAFRIWLTGLLTSHGHPEMAENMFHDFSGWIVFMFAAAVLSVFAKVLMRYGSPPESKEEFDRVAGKNISLASQVTVTVFLCLAFLGGGWFITTKPVTAHTPPRSTFEHFPMQIGDWTAERHYLSKEVLDELWADDYVNATYSRPGSPNRILLLVPYYEYQATRHTVHAPQSCLLGGGFTIEKSEPATIRISPERSIEVMRSILKKGEMTMLGSYYFLQRGRVLINPYYHKYYLAWDSVSKGRTDGALVRVEMILGPGADVESAAKELEAFHAQLAAILPAYVPD